MSLGVFYIMKLFYNQIVVRVIQLYETLKTSDLLICFASSCFYGM